MNKKRVHDIVGCVISADPWYNPKILLVKRRKRCEGEKYWPGEWCYLTEHRNPDETDKEVLVRCFREELSLPPLKYLVSGPVNVESRDPDYHELFRIRLYQCLTTDLDERMKIFPKVNTKEASKWTWASSPFYPNLGIRLDQLFEDIYAHLDMLHRSPVILKEF